MQKVEGLESRLYKHPLHKDHQLNELHKEYNNKLKVIQVFASLLCLVASFTLAYYSKYHSYVETYLLRGLPLITFLKKFERDVLLQCFSSTNHF